MEARHRACKPCLSETLRQRGRAGSGQVAAADSQCRRSDDAASCRAVAPGMLPGFGIPRFRAVPLRRRVSVAGLHRIASRSPCRVAARNSGPVIDCLKQIVHRPADRRDIVPGTVREAAVATGGLRDAVVQTSRKVHCRTRRSTASMRHASLAYKQQSFRSNVAQSRAMSRRRPLCRHGPRTCGRQGNTASGRAAGCPVVVAPAHRWPISGQ